MPLCGTSMIDVYTYISILYTVRYSLLGYQCIVVSKLLLALSHSKDDRSKEPDVQNVT